MGLHRDDPRPSGISLGKAYSAIRDWYQSAIHLIEARQDDYGHGSAALIRALPPASHLSALELRAVFAEVICGYLEWAYHLRDGQFKMGAYAHAALDAAGTSYNLTQEEQAALITSRLWPFLFIHRGRTGHDPGNPGGSIVIGECPAPDCPLRAPALAGPPTDAAIVLRLMTVGGGSDRRAPIREFLDLVRRVHKGSRAREVILTDPYIYSDAGEDDRTGGYANLVEYLRALNLGEDSEFVVRLNPRAKRASQAVKEILKRAIRDAFPRARVETFTGNSHFHDRFYLVRDAAGGFTGIFGPSLNGLDSNSVVLMGELEQTKTLERLRHFFE